MAAAPLLGVCGKSTLGLHTVTGTPGVRVLILSTGEPNDGVFLRGAKMGGSNGPMIVVTGATY